MGSTPTELFVAGWLGASGSGPSGPAAAWASRRRAGFPADALTVECSFDMSDEPSARVTDVRIRVSLPGGFPSSGRQNLRRAVLRGHRLLKESD